MFVPETLLIKNAVDEAVRTVLTCSKVEPPIVLMVVSLAEGELGMLVSAFKVVVIVL